MRVFRATYNDRRGHARKARRWYLEFRDDRGIVRRLPGFPDKPLTLALGRRVEQLMTCCAMKETPDAELSRWIEGLPPALKRTLTRFGLLDSRRIAASKPLTEHLADFKAWLQTRGITRKQVELVTSRVARVVKGCGFVFWTEVRAAEVEQLLARARDEGLAADKGKARPINAQTSNFYLQAIKQFARWMVREGRASESPLAHISMLNTRADRRRIRRALTLLEVRKLLEAAKAAPFRFGMSGPERALVYRLAVETGLRAGELASLTRSSFDLAGSPPTVTISARSSKSSREKALPLRMSTAETLQEALGAKMPTAVAFAVPPTYATSRMIRSDLEAAGIAYEDESGRVADFHALRHTFITWLKNARVHPKTAQMLARHSTATITLDFYTHSLQSEEVEAIQMLPDLSPTDSKGKLAAAVGAPETAPDVLASCLASEADAGRSPLDPDGASSHDEARPPTGGVAEWPNAAVLKTAAGDAQGVEKQGDASTGPAVLASCLAFLRERDPDLGELAESWHSLPEAVRVGILAMVRAARE